MLFHSINPVGEDRNDRLPHVCPRCGELVDRVHRQPGDRLLSAGTGIRRYHCPAMECGWEGLLDQPQSTTPLWARVALAPVTWIAFVLLAMALYVLLSRVREHAPLSPLAPLGGATSQLEQSSEASLKANNGEPLDRDDPRRIGRAPLGEPRQNCVLEAPGRHPYVGTLVAALTAAQLPSEVVGKLVSMRDMGLVNDRLEISSAGIRTSDYGRHFGYVAKAMTLDDLLCFNTRIDFPSGTIGSANLYELIEHDGRRHSVMITATGGNVAILNERGAR